MPTYYPQQYKCTQCGSVDKYYVWTDEIEATTHKCKHCKTLISVTDIVVDPVVESPVLLRKMSKSEIHTDRKKRSAEHFKKEIMPTINSKDRKHFEKKYGKS